MPKYRVILTKQEIYEVEAENPYEAEDFALEMLAEDEEAFLHEPVHEIEVEEIKPLIKAYWITDLEDLYWGNYPKRKRCSNCNAVADYNKEKEKFILRPYCSYCGAIMLGEK